MYKANMQFKRCFPVDVLKLRGPSGWHPLQSANQKSFCYTCSSASSLYFHIHLRIHPPPTAVFFFFFYPPLKSLFCSHCPLQLSSILFLLVSVLPPFSVVYRSLIASHLISPSPWFSLSNLPESRTEQMRRTEALTWIPQARMSDWISTGGEDGQMNFW